MQASTVERIISLRGARLLKDGGRKTPYARGVIETAQWF